MVLTTIIDNNEIISAAVMWELVTKSKRNIEICTQKRLYYFCYSLFHFGLEARRKLSYESNCAIATYLNDFPLISLYYKKISMYILGNII